MNQRCTVSLARYSVVKINEIIGQVEQAAVMSADDADAVSGILLNNHILTEKFRESAAKVVGAENIVSYKRGLGGEDFAFFSRIIKSFI